MATILDKIISDKREWLKAHKIEQPLNTFQDQLTPSDRNFYEALQQNKNAGDVIYILECKKASPSKGLIRSDFDPAMIAKSYQPYASAISVLTDEAYFQGSFHFLPLVKAQTTQPVLCKDFIIDEYQIYLARFYGANAILLMLSVLDDEQYHHLAAIAHSLELGVLTEASNESELHRAIALGAKVIGINNRDLRDLSVKLATTKYLAPKIPKDRIIISESGIYQHSDVQDLQSYADGFLVGSSLMAKKNLREAIIELIYGHHKVCGLRSILDATHAAKAGARFGGLIFVEASKRSVDLALAQQMVTEVPDLSWVGVFQNAEIEQVVEYAKTLTLSAVQLHGEEDLAYLQKLRVSLPEHCQIWQVLKVGSKIPNLRDESVCLEHHIDFSLIDFLLFDATTGGSGKSFDWQLLSSVPDDILKRSKLAGGININNVESALKLGVHALDLNSGVEHSPGEKSLDLLEQMFLKIKTQH